MAKCNQLTSLPYEIIEPVCFAHQTPNQYQKTTKQSTTRNKAILSLEMHSTMLVIDMDNP